MWIERYSYGVNGRKMSSIYEYPDDNNINWSQVTEISQCIYYFIIITIIIIIIIIIELTIQFTC